MASLCRTIKSVNAVTSLVYFPMLFLSGATIPYELFPNGLQRIAKGDDMASMMRLTMWTSAGIWGVILLFTVKSFMMIRKM